MADAVNKTSLKLETGVDVTKGNHPTADWVHNPTYTPDRTTIVAAAAKYRKLTGSDLSEMSAAEKTAVDDAAPALATTKTAKKAALRLEMLGYINSNWDAAQQLGMLMMMAKGLNNGLTNRKAKIQAIIDWAEDVMGEFYAREDDVDAATTTVAVNAVTADYAQFIPPTQTVRDAKETAD